jgi:hypothetical protein
LSVVAHKDIARVSISMTQVRAGAAAQRIEDFQRPNDVVAWFESLDKSA